MSDEVSYGGKLLSQYGLWELGQFLKNIETTEDRREAAAKHSKFNDKKTKLVLPPPNPEYFKIKEAIQEEIRKKQNV